MQTLSCSRVLALGIILVSSAAGAQTLHVTDELVITLRTGPSTENAVIGNLSSGDAVDVLEQDEELGYTRVRVSDSGDEGWVLTRYLRPQPSAERRLAVAERELSAARARIAELEADLAAQSDSLADTRAELDSAQSANTGISAELADIRHASANAVNLRDQNESLRRRNNELSFEMEALSTQNTALASRSRQNWFIVGAIVLAAGIVIGLVAPSLRGRKKSGW